MVVLVIFWINSDSQWSQMLVCRWLLLPEHADRHAEGAIAVSRTYLTWLTNTNQHPSIYVSVREPASRAAYYILPILFLFLYITSKRK